MMSCCAFFFFFFCVVAYVQVRFRFERDNHKLPSKFIVRYAMQGTPVTMHESTVMTRHAEHVRLGLPPNLLQDDHFHVPCCVHLRVSFHVKAAPFTFHTLQLTEKMPLIAITAVANDHGVASGSMDYTCLRPTNIRLVHVHDGSFVSSQPSTAVANATVDFTSTPFYEEEVVDSPKVHL